MRMLFLTIFYFALMDISHAQIVTGKPTNGPNDTVSGQANLFELTESLKGVISKCYSQIKLKQNIEMNIYTYIESIHQYELKQSISHENEPDLRYHSCDDKNTTPKRLGMECAHQDEKLQKNIKLFIELPQFHTILKNEQLKDAEIELVREYLQKLMHE
jgi:hypothetical protein